MPADFDETAEAAKRDAALNLLKIYRAELIKRGKKIAVQLALANGEVTAPEVVRIMEDEEAPGIHEVDRRFMGAVFRKGWVRVGFVPQGSHCQPISVWRLVNDSLDI